MKKLGWVAFVFFALAIGCYPLAYLLFDMDQGLLSSKPQEVVNNTLWKVEFYQHIVLGGVALLTGWTQFNKTWRANYLHIHRSVGKIYLISIFLSGTAGLYISFFATGGLIASFGFGLLAVAWLFTSA
jgi:small-conductance mechanosensitive channel